MKYTNRFKLAAVVLFILFVAAHSSFAALGQEEIEKIVAAIQSYDYGKSRLDLITVEKLINETYGNTKLRTMIEKELVKVLESDASLAVKQFVCQKLSMIGTDVSVPFLSKMLLDVDTHIVEAACCALSQYPSPAVDAALREALVKAKGAGRIAIINLLGNRQDAKSAKQLTAFVSDTDAVTANAAIAALGKIASDVSIKELTRLYENNDFKHRTTAALAMMQCGQELAKRGKISEAKAIYTQLMAPSNPLHVRRGVLGGRIDLSGSDAVALIFSTIHGKKADLKPAAIAKIRILQGERVSQRFAEELPKLPAYEQMLLIEAIADRGDPVVRPSITYAAKHSESQVRIAALKALGIIGDVSSIDVLVNACSSRNPDEAKAAETSLRIMKGEGVDETIVLRLKTASGSLRVNLINILFDRRYLAAVPLLLSDSESADIEVSRAALRALRSMAGPETLPRLVQILVRLKDEEARIDAERAVQQVSRRIADETSQTEAILSALHSTQAMPVRCSLLRVMGKVANEPAYRALEEASKEPNAEIRNTAVRALSEWPNTRAIKRLLAIIEETDNQTHRIIALRGYIRLVSQLNIPPDELVKNYVRALTYAERADEKKLVLSGLAKVHHPEALKAAVENLEKKDVQREAALAALSIARAIAGSYDEVTDDAMERICGSVPDTNLCAQARSIISRPKPPLPELDTDFFNGKDLSGWQGHMQYWTVKDGIIIGHSDQEITKNEFLWSPVEVKDFYLSVYVKLTPKTANSGIQFRSKKVDEYGQAIGYQADIGNDVWGKLYHEHGRKQLDWTNEGLKHVKHEEWNHYEILAVGHRIWTAVNGRLSVAFLEHEGETAGFIALQIHSGQPQEVQFRDLRLIHNPEIRMAGMNEDELNAVLRQK